MNIDDKSSQVVVSIREVYVYEVKRLESLFSFSYGSKKLLLDTNGFQDLLQPVVQIENLSEKHALPSLNIS